VPWGLISLVDLLKDSVSHSDTEDHIQVTLLLPISSRENFQEESLVSQKMSTETKPSEWLFKQENNISEEIKQPVTFVQPKLFLPTWHPSTCNGMEHQASRKLP